MKIPVKNDFNIGDHLTGWLMGHGTVNDFKVIDFKYNKDKKEFYYLVEKPDRSSLWINNCSDLRVKTGLIERILNILIKDYGKEQFYMDSSFEIGDRVYVKYKQYNGKVVDIEHKKGRGIMYLIEKSDASREWFYEYMLEKSEEVK